LLRHGQASSSDSGMMAAVATALLVGLIACNNIGMPPHIGEDALIAASVMIVAVAGMSSRPAN
jgi:hypothetical protein